MGLFPQIILSIFISTILYAILFINKKRKLPPGPLTLPILGNPLWLKHSVEFIEPTLKELHKKYGPIITIHMGSIPTIVIHDRSIAHKVFIEHSAKSSGRPVPDPTTNVLSGNQHTISFGAYGPLWKLLRRNLMSEILHPSRVKIYGEGRAWVLDLLIQDLHRQSKNSEDGSVVARDSFQFAMFSLLILMCFGEKFDEKEIRKIEVAERNVLKQVRKMGVLGFLPMISKYIFYDRWRTFLNLRSKLKDLYMPHINAWREHKMKEEKDKSKEKVFSSYIHSLLDIKLPDEGGRELSDTEIVNLCSEFLAAGTDTTYTAMQWTMAELVKNERVQKRLYEEIESVAGNGGGRVKEEELHKMPYLKAVVLEGLRRHSPAHFTVPHSATEDIEIEGYVIPKNATINVMMSELGFDEKVWDDPMEFKPERFMKGGEGEGVDIKGSRGIKMTPFGIGRRMCPAYELAMLHLEYFVANLVREFEWKRVEGDDVDMTEKTEFTTVMMYPLRARLIPRRA